MADRAAFALRVRALFGELVGGGMDPNAAAVRAMALAQEEVAGAARDVSPKKKKKPNSPSGTEAPSPAPSAGHAAEAEAPPDAPSPPPPPPPSAHAESDVAAADAAVVEEATPPLVMTLLGPVRPEALGMCMMHERLFHSLTHLHRPLESHGASLSWLLDDESEAAGGKEAAAMEEKRENAKARGGGRVAVGSRTPAQSAGGLRSDTTELLASRRRGALAAAASSYSRHLSGSEVAMDSLAELRLHPCANLANLVLGDDPALATAEVGQFGAAVAEATAGASAACDGALLCCGPQRPGRDPAALLQLAAKVRMGRAGHAVAAGRRGEEAAGREGRGCGLGLVRPRARRRCRRRRRCDGLVSSLPCVCLCRRDL